MFAKMQTITPKHCTLMYKVYTRLSMISIIECECFQLSLVSQSPRWAWFQDVSQLSFRQHLII